MLSLDGPFGVPNESRYFVDCSFGGRAPTSLMISGAAIATRIRRTMKTIAAIATLSPFSRRQNSCSGERAAISVVAETPPPLAGPIAPPTSPLSSERSGALTEASDSTCWPEAPLLALRERHGPLEPGPGF